MWLLDREIRRAGLSGFNSYLLLKLASRPDVDALRRAVAAESPVSRWLRAPVRRTFPLRGLCRDASVPALPPRVDVLDAAPAGETEPWPSLLNAPLRPERGENVRFTVFPVDADGWRVAFLFSHLLADAKAAERMLVELSSRGDEAVWPDPRSLLDGMALPGVARVARAQLDTFEADRHDPLHVLGRPGSAPAAGVAAATVVLDDEATRAAVAAGRKAAGYAMEGLWYLACVLAADREVSDGARARGTRYVVPLPTSLDRKGETRAFGNNLVFLFLEAGVEEAADPVALARRFRERMLRLLRDRADRSSQAQMEMCRHLPTALHLWLARRAIGGGIASLFFTNPGPVAAGLSHFFGAEVEDVAHFPIPSPEPGICAAVWTFAGRLHLCMTWLRGSVDDDRARALLRRWRERIVGDGAAT